MFASISPTLGTQPYNDWFVSDTTQRQPLGMVVTAVDPYWGTGKFLYLKSNDAVLKGSLVSWDELYQATLLPTTVKTGFPFAVAMYPAASGNFFWAQVEGLAVYKTNATVAADAALSVAAAGIAGTLAASTQLLNVRNRRSATATVTGSALTTNGTNVLLFQKGYDGFALGLALTGTGIGASAVVAGLDPDGKRVYTGTAIGTLSGANQTASGQVTVTGTYTGYGAGIINNPLVQSQIV
jgi:hypothetical protein